MALVEVKVPDIGDFDEVAVIELLVKVGDTVKVEQSLITVESDKASMEIPSSTAGVVKEIKIALGDKVKAGQLIAEIDSVPQQNTLRNAEAALAMHDAGVAFDLILAIGTSLGEWTSGAWSQSVLNGKLIHIVRRVILRVGSKLDWLVLKLH